MPTLRPDTPKLLVLSGDHIDVDLDVLDQLRPHAQVVIANSPESLQQEIVDADIMLVWDYRFAQLDAILPQAKNLKWIHAASVGVNALLTENLTLQEIILTNSRGVFDRAIAEYVAGLYLAHLKDLRKTFENQARAEWSHRLTDRLAGKRALVVGTGSIGREVSQLLTALDVSVTLVGRRPQADDPTFGPIAITQELATLVQSSDLLVLAAPLTEESRHMVDRAVLEAMPEHSYLINVGRGELIDEAALEDVLTSGGIAGAGLDVYSVEPLPQSSSLWGNPRVTVSPHMSADFVGFDEALIDVFTQNLMAWKSGTPLAGVVDHTLGYVPSKF